MRSSADRRRQRITVIRAFSQGRYRWERASTFFRNYALGRLGTAVEPRTSVDYVEAAVLTAAHSLQPTVESRWLGGRAGITAARA